MIQGAYTVHYLNTVCNVYIIYICIALYYWYFIPKVLWEHSSSCNCKHSFHYAKTQLSIVSLPWSNVFDSRACLRAPLHSCHKMPRSCSIAGVTPPICFSLLCSVTQFGHQILDQIWSYNIRYPWFITRSWTTSASFRNIIYRKITKLIMVRCQGSCTHLADPTELQFTTYNQNIFVSTSFRDCRWKQLVDWYVQILK